MDVSGSYAGQQRPEGRLRTTGGLAGESSLFRSQLRAACFPLLSTATGRQPEGAGVGRLAPAESLLPVLLSHRLSKAYFMSDSVCLVTCCLSVDTF